MAKQKSWVDLKNELSAKEAELEKKPRFQIPLIVERKYCCGIVLDFTLCIDCVA